MADTPKEVSPKIVLLIGACVTLVALVESWRGWPLAPFPFIHAFLALVIPLKLGLVNLDKPLHQINGQRKALLLTSAAAGSFIFCFISIYWIFLTIADKYGDPSWDLISQYRLLTQLYVDRYGLTLVLVVGYLLVGVWPAFGEELFYRRFIFSGLQKNISVPISATISAVLFGLRHSFQLAYLLPSYPWVAGAVYFTWAFGLAIVWSWSYHRTSSIAPCILTHLANLVLAPLVFFIILA